MIGRTNTGGSGGGLNFKVVGGTTEPANPKENMIWVNTDQKITGWNFSATDPFNFKIASNAGDVVGTAGGITFTKKNAGKAIFAFARSETFTIPLLISDSQDAAVLARSDGEEHEAFAFIYKDKLWYNTYPGLGINLWDTATPKIANTTDIVAIKEYLVDMLEKAEGVVWFQTGATSPVEFNALKKNAIQVAPLSAKQYISGVWVSVTAKSYQGSKWVDWVTYLYNEGDECTDLTGGWAVGCTVLEGNYGSWEIIAQKNTDHMLIGVSNNSSLKRLVWAKATEKIDLTNINTLVIEYELTGTYSTAALHVGDSAYTESALVSSFVATANLTPESNIVTLDVSNTSGLYYVFAKVYFSSNVSTSCNMKIKKISYQM